MSLRTTSLALARRLASKLDAIFEDAVMLVDGTNFHLSPAQLDGMLRSVVKTHLGKLERVAAAAESFEDFDPHRAKMEDKRALWAYRPLDAQGTYAVVRPDDRAAMLADGMSGSDIEAIVDHLAKLRINELVPTKSHRAANSRRIWNSYRSIGVSDAGARRADFR